MPPKTPLIPISIIFIILSTILLVTAQFTNWKYLLARSIYQVRLFARSKMPSKTPLIPISLIIILLFIPILVTAQTSDNGLVAEWHFDEGSGNIVKDTSGNGNDGTIHGATWVDGKFGKALSFDGKNDYVEVPDSPSLDITDAITIEAWVKTSSTSVQIITRKTYAYEIFVYNPGVLGGLIGTGTSWAGVYIVSGNTNIADGNWHHYVMVYIDADDIMKLYVDGKLDKTKTGYDISLGTNTNHLYHGIDIGRGDYPFDGIIDEVRIYNRALSPEEIKAHYEGVQTALTLTKSLSTSTLQEGTQSTVTLNIKNTGSSPVSNIKIEDSLPSAFKLISGTLSKSIPSLSAEQSTTLQYTFEPYGLGTINLPESTATYQDQSGKSYTAKSKSIAITISAKDSDNDGLSDGQELQLGTDPNKADTDGDGLNDNQEIALKTNPIIADTDGDGIKDGSDKYPLDRDNDGIAIFFIILLVIGGVFAKSREGKL